jgi:hypothetical protein
MLAAEVQHRFGLLPQEQTGWDAIVRSLEMRWVDLLLPTFPIVLGGEWIGIFEDEWSAHPNVISCTTDAYQPRLGRFSS